MLAARTNLISPAGRCHQLPRRLPIAGAKAITLTAHGNDPVELSQDCIVLGSGAACDIRVQADGIAAEHCRIETKKQGQVMATALVGEDMFDDSGCLLDGTEMRPRVSYLLGSGAVLTLGGSNEIKVDFEEASGSNPMVEMMMQGMAASNPDLKKAMDQTNKK